MNASLLCSFTRFRHHFHYTARATKNPTLFATIITIVVADFYNLYNFGNGHEYYVAERISTVPGKTLSAPLYYENSTVITLTLIISSYHTVITKVRNVAQFQ